MVKLNMKPFQWIVYILVAFGALTWGLTHALNFNLLDTLLSWVGLSGFTTWVSAAIGLAGAWMFYKIWW